MDPVNSIFDLVLRGAPRVERHNLAALIIKVAKSLDAPGQADPRSDVSTGGVFREHIKIRILSVRNDALGDLATDREIDRSAKGDVPGRQEREKPDERKSNDTEGKGDFNQREAR
jgi:hypothetical protein